jgi:hypothetical protein
MPLNPLACIPSARLTPRNESGERQRLKLCVMSNFTLITGQWCEVETDPCQSQPCSHGGSCEVIAGPPLGFTCHCPKVSGHKAGFSLAPYIDTRWESWNPRGQHGGALKWKLLKRVITCAQWWAVLRSSPGRRSGDSMKWIFRNYGHCLQEDQKLTKVKLGGLG